MQLYLTAAPEEYPSFFGKSVKVAHLAYLIGADGHLHRAAVSRMTQNGLMALKGVEAKTLHDTAPLCREILRECSSRGFEGVVADFGADAVPDRLAFLSALSPLLRRSGKALYVSAAYGQELPDAHILINTALSGGTLQTMLADACRVFGAQRVALDIERVRMDFLLPCPSGVGEALAPETFGALLQTHAPSVFFSHELCAKYFTYQADGSTHFVLFDDADTIRCKLKVGQSLGIPRAFLLCSEVRDLLPQIL